MDKGIVFINTSIPYYAAVVDYIGNSDFRQEHLDILEDVRQIMGCRGMPFIFCRNPTTETLGLDMPGWDRRSILD